MDKSQLFELLCCPACQGEQLTHVERVNGSVVHTLQCESCGAEYGIESGLPDMVPSNVELDADWDIWRQHLEAFQTRRMNRQTDPKKLVNRMTRSGEPQQKAFAAFTGIRDGVVLDVGCGPGNFRFQLPETADYIGMDPMPLPEATEFPFVRGVAENIPLPDQSVRHITVLSALDHFKDCEAFLLECKRVLEPEGELHIIQQIHEHGISIRGLAHEVKDMLEDRTTKHDDEVPHHMTEFDRDDLDETLQNHFTTKAEEVYSMSFYTPRRMFLTLQPRDAALN